MEPAIKPEDFTAKQALDVGEEAVLRVDEMNKRIVEGNEKLEELVGKKVVIVMGPTGSGKSTVCNAILQPDKIKLDDATGFLKAPPICHEER